MPYTVIDSFKAGLVRYELPLTLLPGSLYEAQDGHITQGGEFQAKMDTLLLERYLNGSQNQFYGLVATDNAKIFTFGSDDYT